MKQIPGQTDLLLGEPLVDVCAIEALTGVPRSTLYQLAREGRMPSVKIGKRVRFSPTAIRNWIDKENES